MSDDYTWWKGAWEAAEKSQLRTYMTAHPLVLNKIEPGYYRSRNRHGKIVPVAFWTDSGTGEMTCHIDLHFPDNPTPENLYRIFGYACQHPISLEKYRHYTATKTWSDANQIAEEDREASKSKDADTPAPDSFEGLIARLDRLTNEARRIIEAGPPSDKETADRAADLKQQLHAIEGQLDAQFEAKKAPLNTQLTDLRTKYAPEIKKAEDYKKAINVKVLTPWLAAQNAKLEQERLAVEQATRENASPPTSSRYGEAKPEKASAGSFGRKSFTRTVWAGVITNRDVFLNAVKDYPAIQEALEKIASQSARSAARPAIAGLEYKSSEQAQ